MVLLFGVKCYDDVGFLFKVLVMWVFCIVVILCKVLINLFFGWVKIL